MNLNLDIDIEKRVGMTFYYRTSTGEIRHAKCESVEFHEGLNKILYNGISHYNNKLKLTPFEIAYWDNGDIWNCTLRSYKERLSDWIKLANKKLIEDTGDYLVFEVNGENQICSGESIHVAMLRDGVL